MQRAMQMSRIEQLLVFTHTNGYSFITILYVCITYEQSINSKSIAEQERLLYDKSTPGAFPSSSYIPAKDPLLPEPKPPPPPAPSPPPFDYCGSITFSPTVCIKQLQYIPDLHFANLSSMKGRLLLLNCLK